MTDTMTRRMKKIEAKKGKVKARALLAQAFELENGRRATDEELDEALGNIRWLAQPKKSFKEIFDEVFGTKGNQGDEDASA